MAATAGGGGGLSSSWLRLLSIKSGLSSCFFWLFSREI
jgi:hypothetical protein